MRLPDRSQELTPKDELRHSKKIDLLFVTKMMLVNEQV